jgi:hypothetical protein
MGNLTTKQSDITLNFTLTSAHGNVTPSAALNTRETGTYGSATGMWQTSGTITGGSDSYDLRGSLIDDLGDPVSFSHLNMIHVKNYASASTFIRVQSPIFLTDNTEELWLTPGAHVTLVDETGLALTDTSIDTVVIVGTTGDQYDIAVVGKKV